MHRNVTLELGLINYFVFLYFVGSMANPAIDVVWLKEYVIFTILLVLQCRIP